MLIVFTCNYLREYYLSIQNIGLAVAYLALYLLVCLSVLWTYWSIIVYPIPFDTGAQTPPHKAFSKIRPNIYIYIPGASKALTRRAVVKSPYRYITALKSFPYTPSLFTPMFWSIYCAFHVHFHPSLEISGVFAGFEHFAQWPCGVNSGGTNDSDEI